MAQIGSFALLFALALSLYCFGIGLIALLRQDDSDWTRLGETARRAGIVVFFAVLLAAAALVIAAFSNDFRIAYNFHHSNRDLDAKYKFATLWSGQEGSLVFWSLLLSAYAFVLRLRYKTDPRLFAHASVVLAGVQVFFLLLVNFAANPFGLLEGPLRPDGSGLNPLLQYPEMVIHPPMLYLGYVGTTIPFAFALGALIMKYPGDKWIHITRRWTMVTWGFLTIGIFLGAHWAYAVLGWGGYWGWDPEGLEHGVGLLELRASDFRNLPHPQRHDLVRSRFRAIGDRSVVRLVPGHHFRRVRILFHLEFQLPAQRTQA